MFLSLGPSFCHSFMIITESPFPIKGRSEVVFATASPKALPADDASLYSFRSATVLINALYTLPIIADKPYLSSRWGPKLAYKLIYLLSPCL